MPRNNIKSLAITIGFWLMATLFLGPVPAALAQQFDVHEIGDGVYVFRMNNRNSPVVITDEGVLVMDPQNETFAPLLKAEIAKWTSQPVKYVVYSHANTDHVRGAQVFADTAQFIAQRRQVPRLEYIKEPNFPMPDILFDEKMEINLGGKEIILLDFGINHSTGVTVMYIPADKIITTIDIVYVRRLAFYFMPDFNPRAWLSSLREIQKLDFDTAVVGHGSATATKADVIEFADYLDDLHVQVEKVWLATRSKGAHVGIQAAIEQVNLEKYKDWGFYDKFRDLNIMAVYLGFDMGY